MYSYKFYHMFLLMLLRHNAEFFARYTITGDDPLSVEAYSTRSSLITYFPRSSSPIATGKVMPIKGQCHDIFNLIFFHESVSFKSLSIPLRSFQFFSKILEIFTAQGAPPVSFATCGQWKKSAIRKLFIILFGQFGT
jgi:hypothetical protein